MSGVPTRLTYKDSSDEKVVIGSMLTGENDNITTCTIKDSSKEWNKVVIEGNQSLEDRLPVSESEYGTARNGEDEPEILVEVFRNGDWEVRDRVYATDGGQTDDRGFYKNNHLYGHGKYTGEQRVEITDPISGDISDGMEALLPSGYSLEVPDDVSIPSLTDYTYKGRRENGYLDLAEPHDWVLVFTAELDSNDNYKVRFEPKGYGDVEGTIIRGEDPFSYDYWKKKDTKTVVSEVTVLGNNPSGETVEVTVTADNPDIKRSQTIRVGYPLTESEAEEIGEDLLQPGFVEHGALEGPLFVDNTVNFSVGIVDDSRGIDDVYTVAEQRDYLHQGETYFSFVFEHEENVRENFMRKGVREERDSLFGQDEPEDVGSQNISAETEEVNDNYDEWNETGHTHNVQGTTTQVGDISFEDTSTNTQSGTLSDASQTSISTSVNYNGNLLQIFALVETDASVDDQLIVTLSGDPVVQPFVSFSAYPDTNGRIAISHLETDPIFQNEDITFTVGNVSGDSIEIEEQRISLAGESPHEHDVEGITDGAEIADADGFNQVEALREILDVDGETAEKLIDLLTEIKTDR